MKDQQGPNRITSGVIAAVSAAVIAVGGGVAWLTWNSPQNPPVSTKPDTTQVKPPSTTQPGNEQTAQIYWLKDNGKNFDLVSQAIKVKAAGDKPDQILAAAFQNLLSGPTEGTGSTTIPSGTKLLSLKTDNDTIRVNLSEEFTSGGGTTSMMGRMGQIIYTATAINPNAKVYIDVNGKQLDVLGGEGLELEQPMTRDSFQKNYQL